jgi:hypothetical protein
MLSPTKTIRQRIPNTIGTATTIASATASCSKKAPHFHRRPLVGATTNNNKHNYGNSHSSVFAANNTAADNDNNNNLNQNDNYTSVFRSPVRATKSMIERLPSEQQKRNTNNDNYNNSIPGSSTHSIFEFSSMNRLSAHRKTNSLGISTQQQQRQKPPTNGRSDSHQNYNNSHDDYQDILITPRSVGGRAPSTVRAIGKIPSKRIDLSSSATSSKEAKDLNMNGKPQKVVNNTDSWASVTVSKRDKVQQKQQTIQKKGKELIVDRFPSIRNLQNYNHDDANNNKIMKKTDYMYNTDNQEQPICMGYIPEMTSFVGGEDDSTSSNSSICTFNESFSGECTIQTPEQQVGTIGMSDHFITMKQQQQQSLLLSSSFDRPIVTIAPGYNVPFVGLEETMYACHLGNVVLQSCAFCDLSLLCFNTATMTVCPYCSTICPVSIVSGSTSTTTAHSNINDRYYDNDTNYNNNYRSTITATATTTGTKNDANNQIEPLFAMGIPLDDVPRRRRFSE